MNGVLRKETELSLHGFNNTDLLINSDLLIDTDLRLDTIEALLELF